MLIDVIYLGESAFHTGKSTHTRYRQLVKGQQTRIYEDDFDKTFFERV